MDAEVYPSTFTTQAFTNAVNGAVHKLEAGGESPDCSTPEIILAVMMIISSGDEFFLLLPFQMLGLFQCQALQTWCCTGLYCTVHLEQMLFPRLTDTCVSL